MKTALASILATSFLAMLAAAQPNATAYRQRALTQSVSRQRANTVKPTGNSDVVYAITSGLQFGTVDLSSGLFLPIGPDLPPDVGAGLVPGPGTPLYTLGFSGTLYAIDPRTGQTQLVGPTGLGDCSTPASPCLPNSANGLGRLDGTLYATDFAQNLYSVDPRSGRTELIGRTGIPALPSTPLTANPDGSINVYDESLFSIGGKLYANFAAARLNPDGPPTVVIQPAIYQIDPKTGVATWIAPTDLGLVAIVNVNNRIYGFSAATGQVVALDVTTGETRPVSDLDPAAGLIAGATPAHRAPR
jgi:outer membrane protein assembly factor BamB